MISPRSWKRLVQRTGRHAIDDAVAAELEFHLRERTEALIREGLASHVARTQAEREFGDVAAARREIAALDRRRASRHGLRALWDAGLVDFHLALRGMAREPWFALTIVLTLALGIGANATMFGIVDRLMLRPPPHVHDDDRLRRVAFRVVEGGQEWVNISHSYPDYTALRADTGAVADVVAMTSRSIAYGRGERARRVKSLATTASLFRTVHVRPALGRFFGDDEDALPSGQPVTVLSHYFWNRELGGDSSVIGQSIDLLGRKITVIGVAPRGFRGLGSEGVDVFLPLSYLASIVQHDIWATERDWYWLDIVVARRRGVSDAALLPRLERIYRSNHADEGDRASITPILASVIPGRGPESSASDRVSVWLMGVAMMVLLIAVANVSNLLLTRASRRRRETSVRLALGVSSRRLAAQLIGESVLLASLGAVAALFVAVLGGTVIRALLLPDLAPDEPLIDRRVFAFAALLAVVCGVAAASAPVLFSRHIDLTQHLKLGEREGGGRRSRLQLGILIAQSAMALLLVIGATLFVRSLRNALGTDVGYETRQVLVATMDLASVGYDTVAESRFWDEARGRVAALPGVQSASLTVSAPFMSARAIGLRVEGLDTLPQLTDGGPYHNSVSSSFFETLGMRVIAGRGFRQSDDRDTPLVAVVNETLARALWPGASALGKCLYAGPEPERAPCSLIVGVVRDGRRFSLRRESSAQYYLSLDQHGWHPLGERTLMVRTRGAPARLAASVTGALQTLRSDLPYAEVRVMQSLLDRQIRPWRLGATLFAAFGGIALLLAAVGLFSVVSYQTAERTREVGVRLALGARTGQILSSVLLRGLASAGAGIVIALATTVALGRQLEPLLYDVSPHDVGLLAIATLTLLAVASVACLLPAIRAARVDPITALRTD
jgi:putative ABC transport system permease protein